MAQNNKKMGRRPIKSPPQGLEIRMQCGHKFLVVKIKAVALPQSKEKVKYFWIFVIIYIIYSGHANSNRF